MQPADTLARLADGLQDWVIDLTHGAARPQCPEHPHPMRAGVVDGRATWTRPRQPGRAVSSIV